jgi:hypothetical protein
VLRKILIFVASVSVALVAFGVAPVASAQNLGSTTFRCNGSPNPEITVTGQVGDTFTAQNTDISDCYVSTSTAGIVTWVTNGFSTCSVPGSTNPAYFCGLTSYSPSGPGTTVTFRLLSVGSTNWVASQNALGITIHFNVSAASAEPEKWTTIPQGLPLSANGTCDALDDKSVAYGSGLTGGWKRSWEPWANPRTTDGGLRIGGWACIRTLINKGGTTWMIEN